MNRHTVQMLEDAIKLASINDDIRINLIDEILVVDINYV
jgi:hypothetical protein